MVETKMARNEIKIFGQRLKKVIEGFNTMKHFGLDEEILICWLRIKTGLSLKDLKLMLKSQEEFYDKLLSKNVLNLLEEDEK